MLILYDRSVYSVGNAESSVVTLNAEKDIYELNALQMSSSLENIYFLDPDFDCSALLNKCKWYLRSELFSVERADSSQVVVGNKLSPAIPLKLKFSRIRKSQLSLRRKLMGLPSGHRQLIKRNDCLEAIVEELGKLIKDGHIKHGESLSWVQNKYCERNPEFASLVANNLKLFHDTPIEDNMIGG